MTDQPMTDPRMPRRAEHVRSTPFLDGLLLHDARRHQVHVLNATGALVWQACDGESTRREVAEAFADALGHPADEVARDIDDHLAHLAALELFHPTEPPSSPEGTPPPGSTATEAVPVASIDEPFTCRPIQVLDRTIVVQASSTEAVAAVDARFADVLAPERDDAAGADADVAGLALAGGPEGWRLHGRGFDLTTPTLTGALDALVSQVNRVAGEARVLALHAAAVRSAAGEVVLLAGPSGAGKSTLAAALVRDGWDYLGDEAIGVTPALRAIGYPKPLSLDLGSCELLGIDPAQRDGAVVSPQVVAGTEAADRIGPCVAGDAGRLVAVVLVDPLAGSAPLRRCEPSEAVTLLAPHAINLPAAGVGGLAAMASLATAVPVHLLARQALAGAVAAVSSLVTDP